MKDGFWNGKTVLVTGHTGFKGSWLSIWLIMMGANVIGYALDPYTSEDNFVLCELSKKMTDIRGDIRHLEKLSQVFMDYRPEIVFHLAAQPIVSLSYEIPRETYEVNVMGTVNVLECIRKSETVRTAVIITTDKCYENKECLRGYVETDPFGGYDPYSSSKACDEILISSWRNSFFNPMHYEKHGKALASVRAGNVIGGGDWSKDRLLPDCIRAIEAGETIQLRNSNSIRPWQHVLEPLSGYLMLAEHLSVDPVKYATGYNMGPGEDSNWNVRDVALRVTQTYGYGSLEEDTKENAPHEAGLLTLNIQKAERELNWYPKLTASEAVDWTVEWYSRRKKENVYNICVEQIVRYGNIPNNYKSSI